MATNNPGTPTRPTRNKPPVGSPDNPSEVPVRNNPTNPSTPISYQQPSGSNGGNSTNNGGNSNRGGGGSSEPTAGDLIRDAREQGQNYEQLGQAAQQAVNSRPTSNIYTRQGGNGLYVSIDDYNKNPDLYSLEPNAYRQPNKDTANKNTKISKIEGQTTKTSVTVGKGGTILSRIDTAQPTFSEKAQKVAQTVSDKTLGLIDFTSPEGTALTAIGFVPVGRGVQVAAKAGKYAEPALNLLKVAAKSEPARKAGRFVKQTAITTAQGLGVAKGIEISFNTFQGNLPTKEEKTIRKEAERQAEIAAENNGFLESLGYNINPYLTSKTSKEAFRASVEEQLKNLGLSGNELQKEADKITQQRLNAAIGEPLGLLAVGRRGEAVGRLLTAESFEKAAEKGVIIAKDKAGFQVGKMTFPALAQAGFQEGAATVVVQDFSRQQDLSFKEILIGGAAGSASAGLLGSTRAGLAVNKPAAGNALGFVLNIVDPLEKPSDLLQEGNERILKQMGKTIKTPVIFTNVPTEVAGFGTTSNQGKGKSKGGRSKNAVVSFSEVNNAAINDFVNGKPNIPNFNPSFNPNPNPNSNPVTTPINSKQPINNFNINFPTENPLNTNTPVMTFNTPINIPTSTPIFRLPPPAPLNFPDIWGGSVKRGKGTKFINELELSGSLLQASIGFNIAPDIKRARIKIKPKKQSKKAMQKSFRGFLGI